MSQCLRSSGHPTFVTVQSKEALLRLIEHILRFSSEKYYDVEKNRAIAVGKHGEQLVLIPYEQRKKRKIKI